MAHDEQIEATIPLKYARWLVSADSTNPALTLFNLLTEFDIDHEFELDGGRYPVNLSEWSSCTELTGLFPELKPGLQSIGEKDPSWKTIIDNWDELSRLEGLVRAAFRDIIDWADCGAQHISDITHLRENHKIAKTRFQANLTRVLEEAGV